MRHVLIPEVIEQYVAKHCPEESPLLKELAKETYAEMTEPQMQVGQIEGSFLRFLVRMIGAKRILEIGTFTGYSALVMAEALPPNGELITCDIDPEATEIAKRYWNKSPHGKKIHLKLGPALKTLEILAGPFDFVFIDADKENYVNYFEACLPKVRQGGLVVADNVLWDGKVLDPKDSSDFGIVKFNEHVRKDPRVESVMLTVRDGLTLAWKR